MVLRFIHLCILVIITVSSFAQIGDTVIQQRVYEYSAFKKSFIITPYLNPALNYYRHNNSLSSFSISRNWDNESCALNAQKGDGWNGFNIAVDSYHHMSDISCIWGNAYYKNGERKNVQWNESADYDILYPYVMADTIGGNIKSETYFFEGGYASVCGQWTLGGEFSYRALLEYRDVDPRPRNSVADLKGKVGASYHFSPQYAIALSAEASKYKQNGNITYYNELGTSKTFHLSGLGTSYTRFNGTRNTVRYQGHTFGTSLDLLSIESDEGWTCGLSYFRSFYEKILPGSNDLTLNELNVNLYRGEINWTSAISQNYNWGIKFNTEFSTRNGSELIYGDAVNGLYPHITTAKQFVSERLLCDISVFYEKQKRTWRWSLCPKVSYQHRKDSYKSPFKKMEYGLLDASLNLSSTWKWNKYMLHTRIWGAYRMKLDATLNVGEVTHPYALIILRQNFKMQSSENKSYGISLCCSKNIIKKMLPYFDISWQNIRYANHEKSSSLWLGLGLFL